jgi:hypothetical protein
VSTPEQPWVEWRGGKCPVPGAMVHYRMADGYEDLGPINSVAGVLADNLRWRHLGDNWTDIIAYRVVQP